MPIRSPPHQPPRAEPVKKQITGWCGMASSHQIPSRIDRSRRRRNCMRSLRLGSPMSRPAASTAGRSMTAFLSLTCAERTTLHSGAAAMSYSSRSRAISLNGVPHWTLTAVGAMT
jgi:hypothetical protein